MSRELSIDDRIEFAKENKEVMNQLIVDYKPFIAKTVKEHVGHYVTYGEDDELSVAMLGFSEAVHSYDASKGTFLAFAKRVIRLRLIDYYRSETSKKVPTVPLEIEKDDYTIRHELDEAVKRHHDRENSALQKLEILSFRQELSTWDITFKDLVKHSPKQEKLRTLYMNMAKYVMEDSELLSHLLSTQRLPVKNITKQFRVHRKKVERGRIYIIACILILNGNYDMIQNYIEWR